MVVIICKRGETIFPIMEADEDGDARETMSTWDSEEEAREFANNNMLCLSSETYFIDLHFETVETNF